MFSTSFGSVTFTRAKYRIFVSFKNLVLLFYTTFASNSYIPPTFSLENVFLYLFPLFFNYHFLSIINTGKCPPPPPPPPPALRFNYCHELLFGITVRNAEEFTHVVSSPLLFAQFLIYVNVAMGTLLFNTTHYVMITYVSFMLYSYI